MIHAIFTRLKRIPRDRGIADGGGAKPTLRCEPRMSVARVLREEPKVEIYRNESSGDAQEEAAKMQARMDGSRVADAGGEKNGKENGRHERVRHRGNHQRGAGEMTARTRSRGILSKVS